MCAFWKGLLNILFERCVCPFSPDSMFCNVTFDFIFFCVLLRESRLEMRSIKLKAFMVVGQVLCDVARKIGLSPMPFRMIQSPREKIVLTKH